MGMSTYIVGVRNLDEGTFAKMMKVKLACDAATIKYPYEVRQYFSQNCNEGEEYLRREMEQVDLPKEAVSESSPDGQDIWEVDLSKVPKDIRAIRFVNGD